MELQTMYDRLIATLQGYESVVLGFSGGVDSSLLAYGLKQSGISYVCVSVKTPLQKTGEMNQAISFCKKYDIAFDSIELDVLGVDEVKANPKDRCYYCKKSIFGKLKDYAQRNGYACVLDGSNADDLFEYRPGLKAKDELGVKSPLADIGFSKKNIRELSRMLGLDTWDMPSSPCLATRIPYGYQLDKTVLSGIDKAERILLDKGVKDVRVRAHGDIARIEVKDVEKAFAILNKDIIEGIKNCGFKFVCLDLEGYKRGCYD